MPVNGRRKGNAAELQVAQHVQFWWRRLELSDQATPDGEQAEFIRTPQSGGWSTRRVRGNYRVAGDISSTSDSWPFTVEVKRREAWTLTNLVAGRASPVWDWWEQTAKAAVEESGIPMLWLRRNKMPWMVLLPEDIAAPILGIASADIYWAYRAPITRLHSTGVHPIGYLGEKFIKTDPRPWLAASARLPRPVHAAAPA